MLLHAEGGFIENDWGKKSAKLLKNFNFLTYFPVYFPFIFKKYCSFHSVVKFFIETTVFFQNKGEIEEK